MDDIDPVIVSENIPGNASMDVDIIDNNMNVSRRTMTLPLSCTGCDIDSSSSSARSLRGQCETQQDLAGPSSGIDNDVNVSVDDMPLAKRCSSRRTTTLPFSCTQRDMVPSTPYAQELRAQCEVQQGLAGPSTSKPSTRGHPGRRRVNNHLELLQEVSNRPNMQPTQTNRTDVPALPLDIPLLDNKENYGSRLQFRIGQNITVDYTVLQDSGILSTDQYAQRHQIITTQFSEFMLNSTHKCNICNSVIKLEVYGDHFATSLTGACTNHNCNNSEITRHHKIANKFYPVNLSSVYMCLVADGGYRGFQNQGWATQLQGITKDSFYRHCKFIYNVMDRFYDLNMPNIK